jgi:hypothetical protein
MSAPAPYFDLVRQMKNPFDYRLRLVTHAEAKLDRLSLQTLNIPQTCLREAVQGGEDAHGCVSVQAADVRSSLLGKDDFLHVDCLESLRSLTVRPKSAKTSSKGIPG